MGIVSTIHSEWILQPAKWGPFFHCSYQFLRSSDIADIAPPPTLNSLDVSVSPWVTKYVKHELKVVQRADLLDHFVDSKRDLEICWATFLCLLHNLHPQKRAPNVDPKTGLIILIEKAYLPIIEFQGTSWFSEKRTMNTNHVRMTWPAITSRCINLP